MTKELDPSKSDFREYIGSWEHPRPKFPTDANGIPARSPVCVVVGAGGFIGGRLCQRLRASGIRVRALSPSCRYPRALEEIEWYKARLDDQATLARCLDGANIVFHLASGTVPTTSGRHMRSEIEADLLGAIRLFDSCRHAGVGRIVFVSTGGALYKTSESGIYSEGSPTNPTTSYGVIKLAIEGYLGVYHRQCGIEHVALRLSNPFGPNQRLDGVQGVVGNFLYKAMLGLPLEIWGDGSSIRDYVYVDDVVDALLLAAESGGAQGVFNIGSGQGRTLIEVISAVENMLGNELAVSYVPAKSTQPQINILDISAAEEAFRWRPKTSFELGLKLTKEWIDELSSPGSSKSRLVASSERQYSNTDHVAQ